jgi:hypothetical protein
LPGTTLYASSISGEINDEMIAAERRYIAAASIAPVLEHHQEVTSLPAAPRT